MIKFRTHIGCNQWRIQEMGGGGGGGGVQSCGLYQKGYKVIHT